MLFPGQDAAIRDGPAIRTPRRLARVGFASHLGDGARGEIKEKEIRRAAVSIGDERHAAPIGRERGIAVVTGSERELLGGASLGRQAEQVAQQAEDELPAVGRDRESRLCDFPGRKLDRPGNGLSRRRRPRPR